ncbi:MAG: ABC transporter permease [Bryobacterales bacterium]|nr:ABC transporter permease [Bryobacterales bacterium]
MGYRLVNSLLTLVLVSFVSFAAVEFAPGDPAEMLLGGASKELSAEALARVRAAHGLNQPMWKRYVGWLKLVAGGNLGVSLRTNRNVTAEFAARIPVTSAVAFGALSLATLAGLSLGVFAVIYEGRAVDHAIRAVVVACHSVPAFLIGLLLIYLCSFKLGWLPLYGVGGGSGLVLPVLTLGGIMGLSLARVVRNALLEAVHEEYFLAALGKGLSYPQAVLRHGLRNSLTLVVSYLGMRFAGLLGGVVLIESVFSLPGMGSYILEAILGRDYPVIQAYMLFFCAVVLAANLLADLLVRGIDPRAAVAGIH